jgi:hypothetical protein
MALFRPPETHLQIQETGRALVLDFRHGRGAGDEPVPKRLAGSSPRRRCSTSRSLGLPTRSTCRPASTWCAGSAGAGSCASATRLYHGTEKDEYRRRGMPWLAGRLARGLWNRRAGSSLTSSRPPLRDGLRAGDLSSESAFMRAARDPPARSRTLRPVLPSLTHQTIPPTSVSAWRPRSPGRREDRSLTPIFGEEQRPDDLADASPAMVKGEHRGGFVRWRPA